MKAVILAAGIGTRLCPLTDTMPKCMVEIDGTPIIEMQLQSLLECGIDEAVICVGSFSEIVEGFVRKRFPNIKSEFVKNDLWESTNYIYSMWLARKQMSDDVILLHGDLVFEKRLLERLIKSRHRNAVLLRRNLIIRGDFRGLVEDGLVREISVDADIGRSHFCPPLYKLSKESMFRWMQEIGKFIRKGKCGVYAEDALNNILGNMRLKPMFYRSELCMEIDTEHDLARARELFSPPRYSVSLD